ncbi:cupin domain-containing protein [Chloroflexota bacterium]
MAKRITRIYTGPDGETHFEDSEIAVEIKGTLRKWSESMKATGIIFMEFDIGHESDWHNAPRRQFSITLEGEGEIEIGDHTKRRFKPGDVLLAEDTTGRGHISRVVSNQPRKVMLITLD